MAGKGHEAFRVERLEAKRTIFWRAVLVIRRGAHNESAYAITRWAQLGVGTGGQFLDSRIYYAVLNAVVEVQGGYAELRH
ncbi:hypothetical protein D3C85_832470 [compost metagenome]